MRGVFYFRGSKCMLNNKIDKEKNMKIPDLLMLSGNVRIFRKR